MLAALAAVALHFALPESLRFGPRYGLASVIITLVVAAAAARHFQMHRLNAWVAYCILLVLTAGLLFGVGALITALVHAGEQARTNAFAGELLKSAAILWLTNIIVFATLYWRLDAGGPNSRERLDAHTQGAFLFPQMTFPAPEASDKTIAEHESWRPHFLDYLFVAFNTSTAFSPTDAPVLTKWAKAAMMVQALISFTTIVLVAARGVNIL